MRDYGIEIGCIEVRTRRSPDGNAIVSSRQLLPPPAAEDYLVKRRRREVEEETREAVARRRNTVTILLENDAIAQGRVLCMRTGFFSEAMRTRLEVAVAEDPRAGRAAWTGLGLRQALRCERDGQLYSCSGLIEKLLTELGFDRTAVPGPDCWLIDGSTSLYDRSVEIEPLQAGSPD